MKVGSFLPKDRLHKTSYTLLVLKLKVNEQEKKDLESFMRAL